MELLCSWRVEAWAMIGAEVVVNIFKKKKLIWCGMTTRRLMPTRQ